MKKWKKGLGLLTACVLVLGMTPGISQAADYDYNSLPAQIEAGETVFLYPGDSVSGVDLYLYDTQVAHEITGDVTSDNVWTNMSGTVYQVSVRDVTPVYEVDEAGQPVIGEDGQPVIIDNKNSYSLNEWGAVLETIGGTFDQQPDGTFSLPADTVYRYNAPDGNPVEADASSIDASVFSLDKGMVNLKSDGREGETFLRWSVYIDDGSSLTPVTEDMLYSYQSVIDAGITPDKLITDPISLTLGSFDSRMLLIPVYGLADAQVPDDAENADQNPENTDPNAVNPENPDPTTVNPENPDPNTVNPENPDPNLMNPENPDPNTVNPENPDPNTVNPENPDPTTVNPEDPDPNTENPEQDSSSSEHSAFDTNDSAIQILSGDEYGTPEASQDAPENKQETPEASQDAPENKQDAPEASQNTPELSTASEPAPEVTYTLSLENAASDHTDASAFAEGTAITVTADAAPEGKEFASWQAEGIEIPEDQLLNPAISFQMPASDVALSAQDKDVIPTQTVTALNAVIESTPSTDNGDGSSSATVEQGSAVTVTANPAPEGQEFTGWNVTAQGEDATTSSTTEPTLQVNVGASDVTVEPLYAAAEPVEPVIVQPTAGGAISDPQRTEEGDNFKYVFNLTPAAGYKIDSFTAKKTNGSSIGELSNENKTISFTVPKDNSETITVTAALSLAPHTLTVASGSGTGQYTMGETVQIAANAPQAGWRFTKWTVSGSGTIASETATQTTFTMGDTDAAVTANYEQIPFTLTVNSGSGTGTHFSGETVVITANPPQSGYRFRNWTVTSGTGTIASTTASQTTFTMSASDAAVTANYELIPYTLTVKNGSGSGSFTKGTTTSITPNFPPSGKEFDQWEKTSGKISIDNKHNYYATVTMKASDATVTALYKDGPNPNNNTITGLANGAEYLKSSTLTFTAAGAGMENTSPNPGDYRYRPASYQIGSVGGSWTASPYTTSMAINAAGDYTLTVTYAKDVYDGNKWNADGTTVTKSVTFHVVNALSVQTGDSSPLIPLAVAGGAALAVIIILVIVLKKRRKH